MSKTRGTRKPVDDTIILYFPSWDGITTESYGIFKEEELLDKSDFGKLIGEVFLHKYHEDNEIYDAFLVARGPQKTLRGYFNKLTRDPNSVNPEDINNNFVGEGGRFLHPLPDKPEDYVQRPPRKNVMKPTKTRPRVRFAMPDDEEEEEQKSEEVVLRRSTRSKSCFRTVATNKKDDKQNEIPTLRRSTRSASSHPALARSTRSTSEGKELSRATRSRSRSRSRSCARSTRATSEGKQLIKTIRQRSVTKTVNASTSEQDPKRSTRATSFFAIRRSTRAQSQGKELIKETPSRFSMRIRAQSVAANADEDNEKRDHKEDENEEDKMPLLSPMVDSDDKDDNGVEEEQLIENRDVQLSAIVSSDVDKFAKEFDILVEELCKKESEQCLKEITLVEAEELQEKAQKSLAKGRQIMEDIRREVAAANLVFSMLDNRSGPRLTLLRMANKCVGLRKFTCRWEETMKNMREQEASRREEVASVDQSTHDDSFARVSKENRMLKSASVSRSTRSKTPARLSTPRSLASSSSFARPIPTKGLRGSVVILPIKTKSGEDSSEPESDEEEPVTERIRVEMCVPSTSTSSGQNLPSSFSPPFLFIRRKRAATPMEREIKRRKE